MLQMIKKNVLIHILFKHRMELIQKKAIIDQQILMLIKQLNDTFTKENEKMKNVEERASKNEYEERQKELREFIERLENLNIVHE